MSPCSGPGLADVAKENKNETLLRQVFVEWHFECNAPEARFAERSPDSYFLFVCFSHLAWWLMTEALGLRRLTQGVATSSRPTWATWLVPGQLGLYSGTLFPKRRNYFIRDKHKPSQASIWCGSSARRPHEFRWLSPLASDSFLILHEAESVGIWHHCKNCQTLQFHKSFSLCLWEQDKVE